MSLLEQVLKAREEAEQKPPCQKCKHLKKSFFHRSIDREATKEFAIKRKIGYIEGEHSKWWVKSYPTLQKGMVCGIRNIWINGKK